MPSTLLSSSLCCSISSSSSDPTTSSIDIILPRIVSSSATHDYCVYGKLNNKSSTFDIQKLEISPLSGAAGHFDLSFAIPELPSLHPLVIPFRLYLDADLTTELNTLRVAFGCLQARLGNMEENTELLRQKEEVIRRLAESIQNRIPPSQVGQALLQPRHSEIIIYTM